MILSLQVSCHTASRLLTKLSSFLQGEGTDRLGIPQPALATSFRLSLRRSKNVFGCYPSSLTFPANRVLKQQTHNLQLSDAVAPFGFLPLREAGFFGVV